MRIHTYISARTLRLLLLTCLIAIGMCLPAVASPAFAASKTPSKVKSVKVSKIKTTSFKVSWKKAAKAKKYQVQYVKSGVSWSKAKSKTVKSKYVTIKKLKQGVKYKVRVRGINGKKKGKWSKTVMKRTAYVKPSRPDGIWIKYADKGKITVEWTPAYRAAKYRVTCKDMNKKVIKTATVSKCQYTVSSLKEMTSYKFSVQSVNGNKKSTSTSITRRTLDTDNVLQIHSPTSIYYTLTRFVQGQDEKILPAPYMTNYDSEGNVTEDGYYFPKYIDLKEARISSGTICQYNAGDPSHPYEISVNSVTNLKVGQSYKAPSGQKGKITNLRLTIDPNEVFDRSVGNGDVYGKINKIMIEIITDNSDLNLHSPYIEWEP